MYGINAIKKKHVFYETDQNKAVKKLHLSQWEITMSEFHGMVGRSSSNSSVKPSSSITQLSLSQSIIVLSKSNTTTTPAIVFELKVFEKIGGIS